MTGIGGYPEYEWHLGSYARDLKYEPKPLRKLGTVFFDNYSVPLDIDLAEYIRNMIVKIGFMMFARDLLKETILGKQIPTHYHLSAFIFFSKAFLDAIANILNFHYELGFERGKIDLKLKNFIDKLGNVDEDLANQISKEDEWILSVASLRDEMIHKKSPLIIFYSKADKTGKKPADLTVKMPIEPVSLFNWEKEEKKLKEKYGKIEQDILPFCEQWISKADWLLQLVCEKLIVTLEKYRKN